MLLLLAQVTINLNNFRYLKPCCFQSTMHITFLLHSYWVLNIKGRGILGEDTFQCICFSPAIELDYKFYNVALRGAPVHVQHACYLPSLGGPRFFASTFRMDFLSDTKYLTLSVIDDLKTLSRCFQKLYYFGLVATVTTQGLLLAKHGNERNYKTKHRMLPYLGNKCMSIVRTKPRSRIFDTFAMATGKRPIRKLCNIIQIWK